MADISARLEMSRQENSMYERKLREMEEERFAVRNFYRSSRCLLYWIDFDPI